LIEFQTYILSTVVWFFCTALIVISHEFVLGRIKERPTHVFFVAVPRQTSNEFVPGYTEGCPVHVFVIAKLDHGLGPFDGIIDQGCS